ncbi:fluoride efflux transporter CrcB [Marinobacter halodurans]|uniref:Fluoride-specific ion channel FluC n=1 Tax=Marinobacter halodurans TaxID=2528979 RepID=A0ABY1ZPX4_9GAMM|nr:fluoride efflux transporter CrcB [Marinobacter halodurans]TBW58907.1 fluoride efflux transporter CrcB [Marinobacter halodurans]
MWMSVIAISTGAACGALLRWFLGLQLNALFPTVPLGTLVANLLGGYLIGLSIMIFSQAVTLSPEWRLFVITGFMGALTTFSTFSAEMVTLLQGGRFLWALGGIAMHVGGSLLMTLAGMGTFIFIRWMTAG